MVYTSTVRRWWASYRCTPGMPTQKGFFGRKPVYAANADIEKAWDALEQTHLLSGYVPDGDGYIGSKRYCPAGIGGKTCQEDGTNCSLHNYCLALDIEYNYNRYIHARITVEDFAEDWFPSICKYTVEQVHAIEAVKNIYGEQMFKWLGWSIGDTMHWQINVAPDRATIDWNTLPDGNVEEPERKDTLFCEYGDGFGAGNSDDVVRYWQEIMAGLGADLGPDGIDGKYGSDTTAAVKGLIADNDGKKIGPYEAAELHLQVGMMGGSDADAIHIGDSVTLS